MFSLGFDIRKYIAIIAVIIVLIMTVLDVSLMNVALPVISEDFGVSESASVWLVTIYQLIIVMLLLPFSSVGDQYSYKKMFLAGVIVFTIGSACCAFSQGFESLLISRAFQAIGASGVMSVNIALIRVIYPRNILPRGLALNAMCIAIATAAGPSLAGWIMSISNWHWLFLINLPLGVFAFIFGYRTLPANPVIPKIRKIDFSAIVLNIIFFGALFYSLGGISRKQDIVISGIIFVFALIIGLLYIRNQIHNDRPMLPVDLFKIRLYSLSIGTSVCSFIAQNLTMISLPFLFLSGMKFSELTTGLIMTPWPVATMIISPIAARLIDRLNPAFIAATGMLIFITGLLFLLTVPEDVGVGGLLWRMGICGIGFGFFQTPNNVVMVMATPVERTGAAGGMQGTARLTGQTMGSTLVTIVFSLIAVISLSVKICLGIAMAFAAVACYFSLDRGLQIKRKHINL